MGICFATNTGTMDTNFAASNSNHLYTGHQYDSISIGSEAGQCCCWIRHWKWLSITFIYAGGQTVWPSAYVWLSWTAMWHCTWRVQKSWTRRFCYSEYLLCERVEILFSNCIAKTILKKIFNEFFTLFTSGLPPWCVYKWIQRWIKRKSWCSVLRFASTSFGRATCTQSTQTFR